MYSNRLEDTLDKLNTRLMSDKVRRQFLINKQDELEEKIESLDIGVLDEVNVFLQKLSEERREAACRMFTDLGTEALKYSLGPDYEMVIEIKEIRKKPNAVIWIKDVSTRVMTDPMTENGGGLVDIISMALRWVMLVNIDISNDGPILIDEPFKMVSKEYVPLVTNFIKKLSDEFGRQVIMVTHNEHLSESCDTIIEVRKIDGISRVNKR